MATTYTVVKGDNLTKIAQKYKTTITKLVELNHISDPDLIFVGQVLKIDGEPEPEKANTTSTATVKWFGLQSNTDSTIFAGWNWSKDHTEHYQVKWTYDTGDGIWFVGSDSTTKEKHSTYSAPQNAKRIRFTVKPISQTYEQDSSSKLFGSVVKKTVSYWTAGWSTVKTYNMSDNPPKEPPVPTVTIDKYTLKAELANLDVNADYIAFQVVKNDTSTYKSGQGKIVTSAASFTCTVEAGNEYKVRCRSTRDDLNSDWSDYSANVTPIPAAPSALTTCRANSKTSIYLAWSAVKGAESYEIEYATNKNYFNGSDGTTPVSGIKTTTYEKTGLEAGHEYFFRVRAVNNEGSSEWSGIKSTLLGQPPEAPTTWSSTTTAVVGEDTTLYWVHNSEDGSSQKDAELELDINGTITTHLIQNSTDEDEKDKTSSYTLKTSGMSAGATVKWRVRTSGVTNEYGDWSIQRTVDVYAPPTLELNATIQNGGTAETLTTLTSFPFYIYALGGPNTQTPVGYHLEILANKAYETVDDIGNKKLVTAGEAVYSRYFDIAGSITIMFSPGNIDLENNISYTIKCVVCMSSGLTAQATQVFNVSWSDEYYEPNAEITIDPNTYSASIRPYCYDENGEPLPNITLAVYRREFDGGFTELATDIDQTKGTFITDPHPALDYARYRVVATSTETGAVSYYDIPGYPVGGTEVVLQWDEEWSSFDTPLDTQITDASDKLPWSGSFLKLPYNIDVSDSHSPDVALVEYIGRKHPVSYYGTHVGTTSTWNVVIPADDEETLYALRRLALWMGDVYVREPSGSGYWANVTVSFSQKHLDLTIPVSLNIVRVEGGV